MLIEANYIQDNLIQLNSLKLFRVGSVSFLYDRKTSKVFRIADNLWNSINNLQNGSIGFEDEEMMKLPDSILSNRLFEKIFHPEIEPFSFSNSLVVDDLRDVLNTSMYSIILETTRSCNLRCKYCVLQPEFKERISYDEKSMSLQTAIKAIDFLNAHSSDRKEIIIGFYGGEPLLRFDFIKACVNHAKETIKNRKITFGMATNGTLITDRIADYLVDNNFEILMSIDGPKEQHDLWRVGVKDNSGSFESTISGIQKMVERVNRKKQGTLLLNTVFTPPFSFEKLDEIAQLFESLNLPANTTISVNYPKDKSLPNEQETRDKDLTILRWVAETYMKSFPDVPMMAVSLFKTHFGKILNRQTFNNPQNSFNLNGCCLPGHNKAYADVNGGLHICETVSSMIPTIGDVFTGYDVKLIKDKYLSEYEMKSITDCSSCWAVRFCDLCYAHAYNELGEFNLFTKRKNCEEKKMQIEYCLSTAIEWNEQGKCFNHNKSFV